MADNKLAELYVEISAKLDKLTAGLNEAKRKTQMTATEMERALKKPSMTQGLMAMKGQIFAVIASVAVLTKVIKTAFHAFAEEEKIVKRLTANLGYYSKALDDQAHSLQKNTKYSDDQIMTQMALLAAFGKTESQISELTPGILALASKFNVNLTAATRGVVKGLNSGTISLGRMKIKVSESKDPVQRYADVMKYLNGSLGILNSEMEGASNKITNFKNKINEAEQSLGEGLVPALDLLLKNLNGIHSSEAGASSAIKGLTAVMIPFAFGTSMVANSLAYLAKMIINVGRAVAAGVTGDFTELAKVGQDILTDTKDWGVGYYNIVKNTLNTTAGLFENYAEKINSAATFNFQTGKIEPFMPGKKEPKSGGNEDDKTKELSFVEQILKKRTDIEANIKAVNLALQNTKLTESQINDLLVERFNLMTQLNEMNKRNPFEPELPEFGTPEELEEVPLTWQQQSELNNIGTKAGKAISEEFGPAEESVDNMAQQFGSIINAATTIGGILNVAADSFVGKLIEGFSVVTQIANSILGIVSAFTGGLGGGIFSLFGKHGGAFENGKQVAKFAGGGDFMVPSGFSNDSFPMMVQSGERVTVTPSGRVGEEIKMLALIGGKLDALNKNLVNKNMSPVVNVDIDGKKLVKEVTIPNENKLRKAGFNLDAL